MLIYPAIDLSGGEAVRLYKGDYNQKTVYSKDPLSVAFDFKNSGARCIHLVDLDGAKSGTTPNIELILKIKKETGLFCEVGGGIRDIKAVDTYISGGIDRVILGTAAVTNPDFLESVVNKYGEKIAVGVDINNRFVAIKGWTESSDKNVFDFCTYLQGIGVKTVISTDISKDGAMSGTNRELYRELSERFSLDIIASGGVSTLDDVKHLSALGIHGAIIGKAYYTGAVSLAEAIEVAK